MSGAELIGLGKANSAFASYLLWAFLLLSTLIIGIGVLAERAHRRQRRKKGRARSRRSLRARGP